MLDIKALRALLDTPQRVVITTHHKPDADALGSSLAWAGYLKKLGHEVTVVAPSDYPKFLNWMSGEAEVLDYLSYQQRAKAQKALSEAEVIYCLDFNAYGRVHEMERGLRKAKAKKVMIDHHLNPEAFADLTFSEPGAAATAQIIFKLIVELGDKHLIDTEIAECLYAGIMTDTGSFKYDSTTAEVHRIAAEIKEMGVDTTRIHRLIYDNTSLERLQFLGFVLSQKMVVLPQYHTAYIAVSAEELSKYHSQTGDTEGVVNYALSIEGIVMAAMFVQRDDMIKISFRSINNFAVNELASTYFEGGGHKNASGGRSYDSLEQAVELFTDVLPSYQERLKANVIS